jgi:hypothetical protein
VLATDLDLSFVNAKEAIKMGIYIYVFESQDLWHTGYKVNKFKKRQQK